MQGQGNFSAIGPNIDTVTHGLVISSHVYKHKSTNFTLKHHDLLKWEWNNINQILSLAEDPIYLNQ